jgi:hypothetical protein
MSLDLTVAAAQLKIEAPQYATGADDRIGYWLGQAELRLHASSWGVQFQRACVLWTLHRMAMQDIIAASLSGDTGLGASAGILNAGVVTKRKARELEETYGNRAGWQPQDSTTDPSDAEYMRTPYGQEFLALRRTRARTTPGYAGAARFGPIDRFGWGS